jgi:hypothetical protein
MEESGYLIRKCEDVDEAGMKEIRNLKLEISNNLPPVLIAFPIIFAAQIIL